MRLIEVLPAPTLAGAERLFKNGRAGPIFRGRSRNSCATAGPSAGRERCLASSAPMRPIHRPSTVYAATGAGTRFGRPCDLPALARIRESTTPRRSGRRQGLDERGDPSRSRSPRHHERRNSFTPPLSAHSSGDATFAAAAFQMARLFYAGFRTSSTTAPSSSRPRNWTAKPAISSVSAVPHGRLDLAAAQADVLEHVIVHRRKLPHVAADAQLNGDRGDQPRQAAGGRGRQSVEDRRLATSRGV